MAGGREDGLGGRQERFGGHEEGLGQPLRSEIGLVPRVHQKTIRKAGADIFANVGLEEP